MHNSLCVYVLTIYLCVVLLLLGSVTNYVYPRHTMLSHLKNLIAYGSILLQNIPQPKLTSMLSYFLPVNDGLGHGYPSNLLQGVWTNGWVEAENRVNKLLGGPKTSLKQLFDRLNEHMNGQHVNKMIQV